MGTLTVKKQGKNFIIYEEGLIKIENVRFSFPHLDKPFGGKNKDGTDQKKKYSLVGMLSKQTHVEAKDAIVEVMNAMMKEKKLNKMPPKDKFLRNGDDEKQDEYDGHWIVSASEDRKPVVRTRRNEVVTEPDKILDLIQGGYWGHMMIRPWFQDNQWGQKINAGLVGAQHTKDDETFGQGRIDDTDAWAAEDGDDGMGSSSSQDDDDGL